MNGVSISTANGTLIKEAGPHKELLTHKIAPVGNSIYIEINNFIEVNNSLDVGVDFLELRYEELVKGLLGSNDNNQK